MDLEEAIKHAEEKVKCGGKCGEDHAQLAEWLKELRERRAAEPEKRTKERTETHACDSVSRQAAIDVFSNNGSFFVYGADVCKAIVSRIKQLPAAEPERKTGKWIPTGKDTIFGVDVRCSVCGESFATTELAEELYCRHCGAYMGGGAG